LVLKKRARGMLLAIETSCDETSVAIIDPDSKEILANILSTQIEEHKNFGGVVPELASREHESLVFDVVHNALSQANLGLNDLTRIAITTGPGLSGALLVGASVAHGYGFGLNLPVIHVHHMFGHINAVWLEHEITDDDFPMIVLLVSGGHTLLLLVESIFNIKILASTVDDAAGEAFDKVARMLGLDYPGGPIVDKLANEYVSKAKDNKVVDEFKFTVPVKKDEERFSFSGLKTAVLHVVEKQDEISSDFRESVCYSFQKTVVEACMTKINMAVKKHDVKSVAIGGGVAANSMLRSELNASEVKTFLPSIKMCTDNAAMIAMAGAQLIGSNYELDLRSGALPLEKAVFPRWNVEEYINNI
jgi:N6-L-threonylcarbamoyladenine synthase